MRSGTSTIRLGLGEISGPHGVEVQQSTGNWDMVVEMKSLDPGGSYSKAYWNQPGMSVSKLFNRKVDRISVIKNKGKRACRRRTDANALKDISSGYALTDQGRELRVWGGCHAVFGIKFEGGGLEGKYRAETSKIKSFMRRVIDAGDCNASLPADIDQSLPAPGPNDPESAHDAYSEYTAYLATELQLARDACLAENSGTGGSHTSPGTQDPVGSGGSGGFGSGSAIVPGEDIYSSYNEYGGYVDPYSPAGSTGVNREGGTVVPNPFAPPPPSPAKGDGPALDLSTTRGKVIAGGGALALGAVALVMLRKRKKSRRKKKSR